MSDLRAEIYLSVASPKQFLWAPFEMAIINIVFAVVFMLLCIGVFSITPFVSIIPLILGHIAFVILGTRNPHLTSTLAATGRYPLSRRNIAPVSQGVKFVP